MQRSQAKPPLRAVELVAQQPARVVLVLNLQVETVRVEVTARLPL